MSAAAKPASAPVAAAKSAAPAKAAQPSNVSKVPAKPAPAGAAPAPAAAVRNTIEQENDAQATNRNVSGDAQKEIAALKQANQEAARAYAELRAEMEGLEKERDFYFEKLRDIEIVLQDLEDKGEGTPVSASLFKILYATADGFEPATHDGGPTKAVDVYPEPAAYDDVPESY